MAGARIDVREVAHTFPSSGSILEPLSLTIAPGEFVSLLGPSGCGKSTLLRLMAGLLPVQSGSLAVTDGARGGFVFQDATLLPWRTVLANVELPRELKGGDARDSAMEALKRVGLQSAATLYPRELSGGMRMRVSIARALSFEPAYVFLDEPFAALDESTRHDLQMQLRTLRAELGLTIVFVTHSLSEAVFLSDRAILFSPRPARMLADYKINLPQQRTVEMRTSEAFSSEVRALQTLMRRGVA